MLLVSKSLTYFINTSFPYQLIRVQCSQQLCFLKLYVLDLQVAMLMSFPDAHLADTSPTNNKRDF